MAVNYDGIPQAMKDCPHWVLWKFEERDGKKTKVPIQPNGRNASTTNPETWSDFEKAKKFHDMHVGDGLGFVFTRDTFSGLDLDHCRDKSGEIEYWADAYISKLGSYTEISPSGEGVHIIVKGAISDGRTGRKKELKNPEGANVFERMYAPKAAIEIYSESRFFTVTGNHVQGTPETVEERQEVLREVYDDVFFVNIIDERELTERHNKPVNAGLSDDQIINLASSAANSDKFTRLMQGDTTGYPSESEADGALSCIVVFYTRDYPQILRIIQQSKLWDEKWEREDYQKATINSALSKVTTQRAKSTEASNGPTMNVRPVSLDNKSGYIGLDVDGTLKIVTYKEAVAKLVWFSDCPVSVSTETSANGKTEFTFTGIGAKDKRHVSFTLSADDVNELSRFKAAMTNAFGAPNRLGKMSWETAQKITLHTSRKMRVERPIWDGNNPLLPGIEAPGVEYRLSPKIPAIVYAGDFDKAMELLRKAMKINRWTPLLIATILGAPVFARWFKKDRFGLGIWGLSNSFKTSTICALMAMYGAGFGDGPKLKSGQVGATSYGVSLVFAAAGWLPQLFDNVKTVDPHDAVSYIGTMNAVLEGDSKVQGTKGGTIRPTLDYACTPLVTGEVRPQDTATTSRVPAINWSDVNSDILREVQLGVATMPVIGYNWLMHLATVEEIDKEEFYKYQAQKLAELVKAGHTVAGRTATIYSMLATVWHMLEVSPFGAVFVEHHDAFKKSLDEMARTQGEATRNETEVSRFMSGLNELMMGNPGLFMDVHCTKKIVGTAIGKMMPEGVWLSPLETLNELGKIKTFTQVPTVASMTDALDHADLLIHTTDRKKKYVVKMNGATVRGWYVKLVTEEPVTPNEEDGYTQGVTEKPYQESTGYTVTPVSPPKDESVKPVQNTTSPSKQKANHGKKGETGVTGVTREEKKIDNIVTDSDINKDDTVTPSVTPSYTVDKKQETEKDCGSCPAALKGDPSLITCDVCSYLTQAEGKA